MSCAKNCKPLPQTAPGESFVCPWDPLSAGGCWLEAGVAERTPGLQAAAKLGGCRARSPITMVTGIGRHGQATCSVSCLRQILIQVMVTSLFFLTFFPPTEF